MLDDRPAVAPAEYIAGLLAPGRVRRSALSCLVVGTTPEMLRTGAVTACPGLQPVWLAWASEIEALTAHGVTGRTARDAAKIALAVNDSAAGDFRRPGVYPGAPGTRRRVALIAGEMDALTAEGFDAEVYAKEIEQACGGSR